MRNLSLFIVLLIANGMFVRGDTAPQQVHLALTGKPDEMMISWVTYDSTPTSTVKYGTSSSNLGSTATGSFVNYWLPFYESPPLHSAKLTGLLPNTQYYYQVGDSSGGWSKVLQFHTEDPSPVTPSNTLNIAIIADHGATDNSQMVVNAIGQLDRSKNFDLLILSGDLSYANGIQKWWDIWGRMIEPLSSHFPWMVAPGNHEAISLFIPYNYRFNMPQTGYEPLLQFQLQKRSRSHPQL